MNAEFRDTVVALSRIVDRIEEISHVSTLDRRKALIDARRELAATFEHLHAMTSAATARSSGSDTTRELQRRLAAVRQEVALHQATWSAVLINDNAKAYRDSATQVIGQLRIFIAWSSRVERDGTGPRL